MIDNSDPFNPNQPNPIQIEKDRAKEILDVDSYLKDKSNDKKPKKRRLISPTAWKEKITHGADRVQNFFGAIKISFWWRK